MEISVTRGDLWRNVTATAEEIEASAFVRNTITTLLGVDDPAAPDPKAAPAKEPATIKGTQCKEER